MITEAVSGAPDLGRKSDYAAHSFFDLSRLERKAAKNGKKGRSMDNGQWTMVRFVAKNGKKARLIDRSGKSVTR